MAEKIYAGIGSRKTPDTPLFMMMFAARELFKEGWALRTGGAPGADVAFMAGAGIERREVHLPWGGFNGLFIDPSVGQFVPEFTPEVERAAAEFHPAWSSLSPTARKLMCRNTTIILGRDLDTPVDMILCWTPGGEVVGGTGHGIRIAHAMGIPVYNFARERDIEAFQLEAVP